MSAFSKIESFLTKAGAAIASGLEITSQFVPVLQPFFGAGSKIGQALAKGEAVATTAKNDLTAIGSLVVGTEAALRGQTGALKLQAATALVLPIVKTSELVSGHQIGNESEFVAGTQDLINAVVRIMNSLKANQLQTSGDPSAAPAPLATPVVAPTPAPPPDAAKP